MIFTKKQLIMKRNYIFITLITLFLTSQYSNAQLSTVFTLDDYIPEIAIKGNELFALKTLALTGTSGKIYKADLTSTPTVANEFMGSGFNYDYRSFAFKGNDLYMAKNDDDKKIVKIDVTANNPTITDVFGINDIMPSAIAFHGNNLYIGTSDQSQDKIHKIDITDANPTATHVVDTEGSIVDMVIVDDMLYATMFEKREIIKIDITSPTPTVTNLVVTNMGRRQTQELKRQQKY